MTYATRFKDNLLAGSAFSGDKMTKKVSVKSSGYFSRVKKVIDWDAIFVEPNTAQGVVAMAIMAPLAVLAAPLSYPLLLLRVWASDKERKEGGFEGVV